MSTRGILRPLAALLPWLCVLAVSGALAAEPGGAPPRTGAPGEKGGGKPVVVLDTSKGKIRLELDSSKAPITVKNFLRYVDEGHYDGTIFHRVIPGFMIQGGGFTPDMKQEKTHEPIKNEAANGLENDRGSVAMARTSVVDSATAQFFINVADNDFLNHRSNDPRGFGYAVFGHVIEGMDVVDAIVSVPTGTRAGHGDVPLEPVVIRSIRREKPAAARSSPQ